ncbi:lipoyl(octanoyl) transferase LipB [Trueperella sp. LYQ141]|uniref:lipoyl(octanoyl) transferase LipB n=1 Tax=Trueperella sp. LYQ141 TaxID=3391058 RepID=UPI003983BDED
MRIVNLLADGPQDYMTIDRLQRYLHHEVSRHREPDTLIVWEADHVFTAGRRTADADIPHTDLPVIRMDRGGSVTYHGPGQLVIYPIVSVQPPADVVRFVRRTEEAIMAALRLGYQLDTAQVAGRSGVWILQKQQQDAKICAIGIKFADNTTMHGMALNVSTDLAHFQRIIPCGLADAGVTSLAQLGISTSLTAAAEYLIPQLSQAYAPLQQRTHEDLTIASPQSISQLWAAAHRHPLNLPNATGTPWHPHTVSDYREEQ